MRAIRKNRNLRLLSRPLRVLVLVASALSIGLGAGPAKADPARDFVVSCTYGVLAGTLVGAATLAFTDKPGENLNKVARGASLGLYAGILLGAYIVYGVPAEDEDAAAQLNRTGVIDRPELQKVASQRLHILPLIGDRGLEGVGASLRVLEF